MLYFQIEKPPKAGAFQAKPSGPTAFRKFYERGDFPIALEHDTKGNKIAWKVCLVQEFMALIGNKILNSLRHFRSNLNYRSRSRFWTVDL